MKLRSCLLFACMAVVPLVAMFSHKIPREWRLAMQRFSRGAAPTANPARVPEPAPPAVVPVAAVPAPTPPRPPEPISPPADLRPVTAAVGNTTPPATPPQPSPPQLVAAEDAARSRGTIEDRLRALGAVSIECVPMMQGTSYRCSCRVPADPSGQLQRVFQSSNPDPVVALRNLHGQVQFWKHRLATRPDVGNPLRTADDGGQPGLR
ncbi:MAG: hypothetical protein WCR51_02715 [Planctomycetia bacterium]